MDTLYTEYDKNKKKFDDDFKDCSDFLMRETVICGEKGFFCVMDGLIDSLQLSQLIMSPILERDISFHDNQDLQNKIKLSEIGRAHV